MPENLQKLAETVLNHYDIEPKAVKVIQGGSIKTVWKVYTKDNLYCLKRLRHGVEKSLFSIEAQKFMSEKGAKVPGIIQAKTQKYYIEYKGQVFVLYHWINGRQIKLNNKSDFQKAVKGLAEFHLCSSGYQPPRKIRISSKLWRWPHQYESMRDRLLKWRGIASDREQNKFYQVYLEQVDYFVNLANKAQSLLYESFYEGWVKEAAAKKMLCHQDYGEGNALLTESGIFVLDLDSVTFELPARDLRKIILKTMSKKRSWDKKILHQILDWYEEVNPLTEAKRKVLFVDLLFPHEFHNVAKNSFQKDKDVKALDLSRAACLIREKVKLLENYI